MFKALKVDHIGIAVKDLEQAKKFYTEVLGLQAMGEEVVEEQKVRGREGKVKEYYSTIKFF